MGPDLAILLYLLLFEEVLFLTDFDCGLSHADSRINAFSNS